MRKIIAFLATFGLMPSDCDNGRTPCDPGDFAAADGGYCVEECFWRDEPAQISHMLTQEEYAGGQTPIWCRLTHREP